MYATGPANLHKLLANWSKPALGHLEFVITEEGDAGLQAAVPVLCLGQLGGQMLVQAMQLGVAHRLLEQLLLHLLLQLLQSCYLHHGRHGHVTSGQGGAGGGDPWEGS